MNDEHAYDALWTLTHPYSLIRAGEYDMDAGYRIRRPEGSADDLLLCTLSGDGLLRAGSCEFQAAPGCLFRFAPGAPQDYGTNPACGRWHFLWCHFHAPVAWRPLLDADEIAPGLHRFDMSGMDASDRETTLLSFRRAVEYALAPGAMEDELAMNLVEHVLLLCRRVRILSDDPEAAFVEKLRSHIMRNLRSDLSTVRLAAVVSLSPSRMTHRFKAATGMTPQEFVETCRLQYALRLLATTSAPVKEVAYECGFSDPLYFSRRFSKRFGYPPGKGKR